MDSWGVAALVDEPAPLVVAFVSYHLDLGASEVHVMLDRPNEEVQDILIGVPGAFIHQSGEDGWAFNAINFRPPHHLGRQKYFASRILAQTGLDWLVHCDADEFLMPLGGETIAGVLTRIRKGASWLKIKVAERVHCGDLPAPHIFTGAFREAWWENFNENGGEIYDEVSLQLLNRGLCGHQIGKCAVRSGLGLFIGVHQPLREYGGGGDKVPSDVDNGIRLLHFDGLTPLQYMIKMLRRALVDRAAQNPPKHALARKLQFTFLADEARDPAMLMQIYMAAKSITDTQCDQLEERELLGWYDHRIPARVNDLLGEEIDLSPVAFDHALLEHEAGLFTRAHDVFGFDPTALVTKN